MNKKGGEKLLSVWWFFVLVVIGGSIVIGVLIYYSADVNIKELEADILTGRIIRCVTDRGYLKQDFLQDSFDIFKECDLRKEVFGEGSDFYFKISVEINHLLHHILGVFPPEFRARFQRVYTPVAPYYPNYLTLSRLNLVEN